MATSVVALGPAPAVAFASGASSGGRDTSRGHGEQA